MSLIWAPNLTTGIDWQDNQHKELFKKINALIDAMNQGKAGDEIGGLFSFLDNYVREHFRNEETAMDKHKYPDSAGHKGQHKKFIDNIKFIKDEFQKENAHKNIIEARKLLADWFFEHIAKIDKKLGDFLKPREIDLTP
ncbi:MAG: hemerythrin family protein [Deltaproteobacteria bacterium]|nr:hemerythrin family protein [Deltaproteobacteria bacterium]